MKPRTKLLLILAAISLFVLIAIAVAFLVLSLTYVSDEGSPGLASECRKELDAFATPDDAVKTDPTIEVVKFKNGEWLIGRCQDSHGISRRGGGGTMVMKDSRGETRALKGHVCGSRFLSGGSSETADLDTFYSNLKEWGFVDLNFQ